MMSAETDKSILHPPSSGRRLTAPSVSKGGRLLSLRAIPSILLGGVCVWAVIRLFVLRTEESDEQGPEEIYRDEGAAMASSETGDQSTPRLIDGERLLSVRVLRENLNVEPLSKNVLRPGEATVLNFWGTFCTPCIDELPAFKELTDDLAAPMLHFVPVLVDDQVRSSAARTMYDKLKGPNPSEFVSDGRLPDADSRGLTELEAALGGRVSLPTTVVLDCVHNVRWSKTGKLEDGDFTQLRDELDLVMSELDSPTCVAERRRARRLQQARGQDDPTLGETTNGGSLAPKVKPRSACNADGVCDSGRGETVKSCPVDCKPKILPPSI